jgi:hypothetical protein
VVSMRLRNDALPSLLMTELQRILSTRRRSSNGDLSGCDRKSRPA